MFFLQILRSASQEIAMYFQSGTAGAVYWAIVITAILLAVLVMYQSLANPGEDGSRIEESKEDQALRQAA